MIASGWNLFLTRIPTSYPQNRKTQKRIFPCVSKVERHQKNNYLHALHKSSCWNHICRESEALRAHMLKTLRFVVHMWVCQCAERWLVCFGTAFPPLKRGFSPVRIYFLAVQGRPPKLLRCEQQGLHREGVCSQRLLGYGSEVPLVVLCAQELAIRVGF